MIPIFIGGTGRSGTSILKRFLQQHPNAVAYPHELRVITDPGGALDLVNALSRDWEPYKADYAIQEFQRIMRAAAYGSIWQRAVRRAMLRIGGAPRRYTGVNMRQAFGTDIDRRLDSLLDDISYHVSKGSWIGSQSYQFPSKIYESDWQQHHEIASKVGAFFTDLFEELAKKKVTPASHWIEDTPYNLLRADELLQLFPTMKLIHIYRDPRDVLASYLTQDWGGDEAAVTARRLHNVLKKWRHVRENMPLQSYIEVSFEALAHAPQTEANKIIDFVGLPVHKFTDKELSLIDLRRAHLGRWKEEIPPEALHRAMNYLSPWVDEYGYEEANF